MATVRPLNDALKVIASKELNENERNLSEELAALKSWIDKQPHLRACTDDQFLLAFLRACKHSLEKAKSKIEHYYTIKTLVPEIFRNRCVNEKYIEFIRRGHILFVPTPAYSDWPCVGIQRFDGFDANETTLFDILRYRGYELEYFLRNNDNCIVAGFVEIFDMKGVPLSLYKQLDLPLTRKLSVFVKKGLPIRYKGLHVINLKKEYTSILNYIKSILLEEHKKIVFVHQTLEDLHEYVPRELLPEEYGGTNGKIDEIIKENVQNMMDFNELLVEDDNYGVDDKLRSKDQSLNIDSLFGVDGFGIDGSFKKLEID